ncbi:hypothetical protein H257_17696 [Aphanomyces astaci]|uniref:Uncharacterized protein n=1 Tax=Aphanomyces astaci TaxID=112090 RepID=W4FFN7_APHAT|nr:hypothetical protein H257_17696 [Aphanomyces astaci]ETV65646.1 hypothetical protein H257_17696 [Aphanomyces astaci]|eukprot:XP_009844885.1 hypothetical protein H257_17696 [Aphanomyces astaci]
MSAAADAARTSEGKKCGIPSTGEHDLIGDRREETPPDDHDKQTCFPQSTPVTTMLSVPLRLPSLTTLHHHYHRSTAASSSPFIAKTKSRKRKMSMLDVISSHHHTNPLSLLRQHEHPHHHHHQQQRQATPSSLSIVAASDLHPLTITSTTSVPPTKSTQHVHTRGRTKRGGRAHVPAAPAPRTASSIARLTSGKDVCVVAHHGTVDWVATYYVYGFDKNSLFHLLVPLRHPNEPWTDAETAYLTILARLLHQGTMRVPRGKSLEAYLAEKLHAPEPRIRVQLQTVKCEIDAETGRQLLTDGHRPKGVMTPDEAAQLKQSKASFLQTLEPAVVAALHANAIDQSCVVSIKY